VSEGFGTQTRGLATTPTPSVVAAGAAIEATESILGNGPMASCAGDRVKITYHAMKIKIITSGTKTNRQYRLRLYFGARFVGGISDVFLGKTSSIQIDGESKDTS
jgi:hypothetical protein